MHRHVPAGGVVLHRPVSGREDDLLHGPQQCAEDRRSRGVEQAEVEVEVGHGATLPVDGVRGGGERGEMLVQAFEVCLRPPRRRDAGDGHLDQLACIEHVADSHARAEEQQKDRVRVRAVARLGDSRPDSLADVEEPARRERLDGVADDASADRQLGGELLLGRDRVARTPIAAQDPLFQEPGDPRAQAPAAADLRKGSHVMTVLNTRGAASQSRRAAATAAWP